MYLFSQSLVFSFSSCSTYRLPCLSLIRFTASSRSIYETLCVVLKRNVMFKSLFLRHIFQNKVLFSVVWVVWLYITSFCFCSSDILWETWSATSMYQVLYLINNLYMTFWKTFIENINNFHMSNILISPYRLSSNPCCVDQYLNEVNNSCIGK